MPLGAEKSNVAESSSTRRGGGKEPAEEPVSLAPLSFDDAVKTLAQVKPDRLPAVQKLPRRSADEPL